MLKGVTKRIIEIKSPDNGYFERAVLYLRPDRNWPEGTDVSAAAAEYLSGVDLASAKKCRGDSRALVAVLSLSLGAALAALAVVLVLYTKM